MKYFKIKKSKGVYNILILQPSFLNKNKYVPLYINGAHMGKYAFKTKENATAYIRDNLYQFTILEIL